MLSHPLQFLAFEFRRQTTTKRLQEQNQPIAPGSTPLVARAAVQRPETGRPFAVCACKSSACPLHRTSNMMAISPWCRGA